MIPNPSRARATKTIPCTTGCHENAMKTAAIAPIRRMSRGKRHFGVVYRPATTNRVYSKIHMVFTTFWGSPRTCLNAAFARSASWATYLIFTPFS